MIVISFQFPPKGPVGKIPINPGAEGECQPKPVKDCYKNIFDNNFIS
jgi:hypothetical protein